ncbi:hypothetical protein ACFQGT_09645 [Natrialbaceae archaeon GCM10025810]|uniref:hypothetical protein n=1 Tax=Halovalidus salilacus TaxID=3075124 RepID=UPI00361BC06B
MTNQTVNLSNYDPKVIDAAFRLQEKIKREGLEGIGYMDHATIWMERNAASTVSDHIGVHLKSEFGGGT